MKIFFITMLFTLVVFFNSFGLSSQWEYDKNELKPIEKQLPVKGFYYMAGPKNDKKEEITKTTRTHLVLETIHATIIVSIIDKARILRAIYSDNKIVALHEVGLNLDQAVVLPLTDEETQKYDLKFNETVNNLKIGGEKKGVTLLERGLLVVLRSC
ncbi:uncharacterized protein LOC117170175 [Belonocnema kinseyi]|uniref:uncharacterized protein LOC117170175 n=1 Tax=Belonocnema kinseyi TaxID=2817044 RepID=UPI00143D77D6|nr:uncharacterized protein LOC117170175 [Belonocnema kinseyi]